MTAADKFLGLLARGHLFWHFVFCGDIFANEHGIMKGLSHTFMSNYCDDFVPTC